MYAICVALSPLWLGRLGAVGLEMNVAGTVCTLIIIRNVLESLIPTEAVLYVKSLRVE